ncbi:unnamed protein product [Rhizophagus irregularis]|uniref:Uncharacterized protein n=1 Tax=Rhizophagus irregularis TaxID=588596 RepID=A0A2I1HDV9_9GLOM|nr:hypothetical protein RhiirA4_477861 [Rhizophagus irregularis]CAB4430304.1 unnamed protein product [Rhizophagus irregularis]
MLFILGPSVSVWKLRNGEFRNSKFRNGLFRLGNFGTVDFENSSSVFGSGLRNKRFKYFGLGTSKWRLLKRFKCEIRNGELRNGILWILDFDSLRLLISGWDAKKGNVTNVLYSFFVGFGTQGPETAKLFRYSKILNGFVELGHLVSVLESINWSLGHQWLETAP